MSEEVELVEGVTGDESIPFESWDAYVEAVEKEEIDAPPVMKPVKQRPGDKYAFNVDEALDVIDLKFDNYVPSEDALKFFNIIRMVMGEDPEVENSIMHYFLVDLVFDNITREQYPYSDEINGRIRLNKSKIAIIASRFSAKALSLGSKVYTPSGYSTIGDIAVGDEVLDRYGKRCTVLAKSPIFHKDVYRMTLADGRVITMSDDHDNIVWKRAHKFKGVWPNTVIGKEEGSYGYGMVEEVVTAKELYDRGVTTKRTPLKEGFNDKEYKFYVPLLKGEDFDYEENDFGMDPYTVGVILGDGYVDPKTGQPRITYHVQDSYEYLEYIPYEFGKEVRKILPDGTKTDCYSTTLRYIGPTTKKWIGVGTSYFKRVPKALMTGSYYQRLEVLRGLMDTDGSAYKNGYCSFTSTSKGLAEDVQDLVRATGGSAFITEVETPSEFGKAWAVRIKTNTIIFKLKRKKERQRIKTTSTRIAITKIEKVEKEPTQCIAVSGPTKSFLTDGYTVTHNSTILTAFLPIYCAVTGHLPGFGNVMFWVSFGDSQQAGAKVQANTIRDICEDSVFCKDYFEKMRFTDEECEFVRKGEGKVKKRAFMFKVKGAAGGSVRGIRYKTERPQIFTFDDIIKNEADASSPIIMAKLRSMIYSDASNALGRKGKIIIVNTPFNKNDPIYSALESGVWTPVCIPVCEKIYMGMPKEEYVGSWEAMKGYEDIMEKYEDAYYGDTLREFNQELMLRIADKGSRLIDVEKLQYVSRKDIMNNIDNYNIYVTTDFTASNSKTSDSDNSAIFEWALDSAGNWYLLDLTLRKMGIEEQYEPVFDIARKYRSMYGKQITVGIELDGQQQINLFALKKLMIEKQVHFNFARQVGAPYESRGITRRKAGGDKHMQFMRAHPLFQDGKLFFCEELTKKEKMSRDGKSKIDFEELLDELRYLTYLDITSKHDDGLDAVSMLALMDVIKPAVFVGNYKKTSSKHSMWGFEDGDDRPEPSAYAGY